MPRLKTFAVLGMLSLGTLGIAALAAPAAKAAAPNEPAPNVESRNEGKTFSEDEVFQAASNFLGETAEGLAEVIHAVFAEYGEPNAYIAGQEGSGAIGVGLRYGSGQLVMKDGPRTEVFWQGPSAGWDFGGNASKVFTLVYNLPDTGQIYQRFPGVEGSAYYVGGVGVNYQQRGDIVLAPIRAGVGLRLGANVGYLKYTREREWLPF
ncbi:conserved protein [Tepidicaulis marinus]|uniref:Conserved protein n=1 Tax=Tepidicaulis marinus TaxID=1333998 RepID=A0A081BEJ4_9HYPH|nr:DUF1134 domain-containing protein [Tepidicaulis marinus]GAK46462.1 conserved protein [Tepidicaulis marinus]